MRKPASHAGPAADVEKLALRCRCAIDTAGPHLGCLECAAPCCSACAIMLESVAYCRECATALVGAAVTLTSGSFELY